METGVMYLRAREGQGGGTKENLPLSFQKELTLPVPGFHISGLWKYHKINVCCFRPLWCLGKLMHTVCQIDFLFETHCLIAMSTQYIVGTQINIKQVNEFTCKRSTEGLVLFVSLVG